MNSKITNYFVKKIKLFLVFVADEDHDGNFSHTFATYDSCDHVFVLQTEMVCIKVKFSKWIKQIYKTNFHN